MPLHPQLPLGMAESSITGNSMISSQLVAGSIIIRHIKSISVPSFPLRVNGPMRLPRNHKVCKDFAILVFIPFFYLVFMTVFDIFSDGIAHTFPVHLSMECLLKMG